MFHCLGEAKQLALFQAENGQKNEFREWNSGCIAQMARFERGICINFTKLHLHIG